MVEYSPEVADEVCRRISAGESLLQICRDPNMPHRQTVNEWVTKDIGGMGGKYARARELRADHYADEIIEIADSVRKGATSEEVQAARLASDNRRWYAGKLSVRYGDKVQHVGADGKDLIPESSAPQLLAQALVLAFTSVSDSSIPAPSAALPDKSEENQ